MLAAYRVIPPPPLLPVNTTIDDADEMMHGGRSANSEAHYFRAGRAALGIVEMALRVAGVEHGSVRQVLDMACGHGRVLRHMRAAWPDATITACDVNRGGVDFCARTFGAKPLYSQKDLASLQLPAATYDLVFVGSLFTHLDAARWRDLLCTLTAALRVGGVLVMSVQGPKSHRKLVTADTDYCLNRKQLATLLRDYEQTGFGYVDYVEGGEYGVSLASEAWVTRTVADVDGLLVLRYDQHLWDDHHDVYVCSRRA